MSWGRGRVPRPQLRTVTCAREGGPMSHLGPWFERPQNRQYRIVCVPLLPPISSPNEWGCSNRLGRASLLPRIPAFALEHGLTWIGAEPSSVRSGRFSPTGGVTPVTARGVDEHFCHVAQVRATRVPEHSGCCCFSSRHRAARCSRHVERSGGLVRMTGVFKHKVRRVRVVCMEQWGIPSSRDRRWG